MPQLRPRRFANLSCASPYSRWILLNATKTDPRHVRQFMETKSALVRHATRSRFPVAEIKNRRTRLLRMLVLKMGARPRTILRADARRSRRVRHRLHSSRHQFAVQAPLCFGKTPEEKYCAAWPPANLGSFCLTSPSRLRRRRNSARAQLRSYSLIRNLSILLLNAQTWVSTAASQAYSDFAKPINRGSDRLRRR